MFESYVENCEYTLGYDDEGFEYRIPNGSRIITSDDIFDYMLTVRTNNNEISENKEIAKEEWVNMELLSFLRGKAENRLRIQVFTNFK